jgi:aryl-alcohol dehydrogenase-like predicted oxidoreductase
MKDLLSDEILTAVQQLKGLAEQSGYTLAQMSLAWVLRQQNVTSVIIGASRPQQVEENVKASEITLSDDLLNQIDEILGSAVGGD